VARNLITLFARTWDDEGSRNPLLTLLRAVSTEPRAAELLRDFLQQKLFAPLMDRLGVDRPELRADLAMSQLIGLGLTRYVLKLEPLAAARPDELVAWVAPNLQRYLTGRLEQ
jgi:Tetracyclin repressor-like, C-terminal domain